MIDIHGRGFFTVIYSSIFHSKQETKKGLKSQTSMMQFFNALIHMLTVANLDGSRKTQVSDYIYTIRIFVIVTVITTLAAVLNLGVGLYSFQLIMGALNTANAPLFYVLIPLFILSNMVSQVIDFIAKCLGIYVREGLTSTFRVYIEKCYTNRPMSIHINDNQRAFFESIEVACAHIPAMIKLSIMITVYGVYAVCRFHPALLLTSAVVGILVQFINRGASKRLDSVNIQEKSIAQEVKRDRIWMYENTWNHLGINALSVHYNQMKKNISKLYRVKTTLAINKSWQEFLSRFVQLLSNVSYYTYFSSVVFLGYMTLGEMFILLPFIEEIGKSAAKLIALPMMIAPTRTSADNLIDVWNSLVDEEFKVRDQMTLIEMSSEDVLYYMIITIGGMALLQWTSLLPVLKITNVIVPLLFLNIVVRPKSVLAQVWSYMIKVVEYPFISIQKGQPIIVKSEVKHYGKTAIDLNGRRYEFDEGLFLSNDPLQVTGAMGVGKSVTFGLFCGSKLEYNESMISGYFPSEKSLCLTPRMALFPNVTYVESLASTYDIHIEDLQRYLKEAVATIGLDLDVNVKHPSTGVQQLLYVLSGINKALRSDYSYICIDEALSGVSSEYVLPTYRYIHDQCKDKLKLVVIHHGLEIDDFKQVSPTVSADRTFFST